MELVYSKILKNCSSLPKSAETMWLWKRHLNSYTFSVESKITTRPSTDQRQQKRFEQREKVIKSISVHIFTFYTYLTSFICFIKTFTLSLLKSFFCKQTCVTMEHESYDHYDYCYHCWNEMSKTKEQFGASNR